MKSDKRTGKKTPHPGIRRDGMDGFLIRVAMRDPRTRRHREKERRIQGTLADAIRAREALRDELKAELAADGAGNVLIVARPPKGETLSGYAKRWLAHVEKTGRNRAHVIDRNIHVLDRFILPFLGDLDVAQVGRAEVAAWMASLGQMRNDGRPYAKETLATAWRCLRTLFRDALVLCDLERNPTDGIRFAAQGQEPRQKDVLTQDELARLLDDTSHESPDVRAMIWLGFTTGMRFGELSALLWDDVDFGRKVIHVRRSQVNGLVGPTKTRAYRTVPLHPTVAAILEAHKAWLATRAVRLVDAAMVFPSNAGTYRHASMLTQPLARCAARAGIDKHVSAHTMRRTFNNLARIAAGEIVARAMTGHATTAMTEHYSHVSLDEKHKALDAALGSLPNPQGDTKREAPPREVLGSAVGGAT